ncbi:MAG: folate-binding protein YgfZ [Actinobacteria bacterium]|nr:MAG: folate-binding protein YgfZ [Actinomycetota bacterium]
MSEALIELDAQYRQLREECGLVEWPGRGLLIVSGSEAAEYLQGQLTQDVEAVEPGAWVYAALLDRKGHMQADLRVLRPSEGSELWLDLEPAGFEAARRHLQMYKIGREVEVSDASDEYVLLSLIGPRATEIARAVEATRLRTDGGVDLIVPAADRDRVHATLTGAGAVEVSPEAAEILRIEAGQPRFGAEMGTETMPAEAGIVEQTVSFTKGCYIGQETVARLHYKGKPNRHLRGLRLSAPAQGGEVLRLGEKEVGTVGSAAVSPAFGPIGLAILRREAEPGTTLAVGEDGVTAEVTALPFG